MNSMIKRRRIKNLSELLTLPAVPAHTLEVTETTDLMDISVRRLSQLVHRKLVFKKRPKINGVYDNTLIARLLLGRGFQVMETVQEAYKINAACDFDYTDPKDIRHVLYAVAYGSMPHRVKQLLDLPQMQCNRMYELMGGPGELSLYGAADFPDMEFISVDLDEGANEYVDLRAHSAQLTNVSTRAADVLQFKPHKTTLTTGCFIGKQSINYFDPEKLRALLTTLVDNYQVIALELLTPIDSYKNYFAQHECDWLPKNQQLMERFCSDQPERVAANPVTSRLAFSLFLEHVEGGRNGKLLDYFHVSAYDWWMYNLQTVVHMLMQLKVPTSKMWYHLDSIGAAIPVDAYVSKHHNKIMTDGDVITLIIRP